MCARLGKEVALFPALVSSRRSPGILRGLEISALAATLVHEGVTSAAAVLRALFMSSLQTID